MVVYLQKPFGIQWPREVAHMDTRAAGRKGGKIGGKSKSKKKRAAALKNLVKANAARGKGGRS